MVLLRRTILPLVSLAAAACASAGTSGGSSGRTARWSATLKQPTMSSSAVISAGVAQAQAASYGSLVLTPLPAGERTRVELSVTAPQKVGAQLAWAVFPGPCNAATPPVIAATEFPLVDVTNSGTGIVRNEMAFGLDPRATYHVNIYGSSRATDVSNVVMCGTLNYSGPR